MPQIFHRSFNTISKVSIFGAVFILAGAGLGLLAVFYRSSYVTDVDIAYVQPVPFSHQHHVGELGIDCRYCHTSVENSSFAGIPPTKTCMNCHSQIWVGSDMLEPVRESYRTGKSLPWQRVHNLPGFVYFDHSIHVNKGVGCSTCHGRVDQMPLTYQDAVAADGVVPGLPPQPGEAPAAARRGLQHDLAAAAPTRPTLGERAGEEVPASADRASHLHQLLGVPPMNDCGRTIAAATCDATRATRLAGTAGQAVLAQPGGAGRHARRSRS